MKEEDEYPLDKPLVLYKHQRQAVDEAIAELAFGSNKVAIDAFTSFGKSLVLSTLAEELPGKIVIIVTFTALIEQIAEHLDEVGSSYSILKAGMEDKFKPDERIQLVMAQTLHARQDKLDMTADYLLKDEAHVEWFGQKRMDTVYNSLGQPKVIAVSATCYDSKGYKLKDVDNIIRTKPAKELEEDGYIVPVKYFVPRWAEEVNYDEISKKGGDYTESDIDSIVLENKYMKPAIDSMMKMRIYAKKTIVFCNSIEHCDLVASELRKKRVKAYAFHSKIDKLRSDSILRSFRDNMKVSMNDGLVGIDENVDCTVLCAVSKVSVGFSVKDIQLAVMMRKTAVRSLYVQQVGRICRTSPGKEYAELLDIANNAATFGFANESYNPPEQGEKNELDRENERLAAKEIKLIVGEEPTEVDRSLVLDKVEELKAKAKRIPELDFKDLLAIYETSQSVRQIIEIGYDINRRKTGQAYRSTQIDWATELWIPFMDKYPEFRSRILRSLRTRLKNIVSQGKKIGAIHYFPSWLSEQTPYAQIEVSKEHYNALDNIDMSEIPY